MTTKKQLLRGAKGREYRDKPLPPHAALGLAVSKALSAMGVKTLYLPNTIAAYSVQQSEERSDKLEIVLVERPYFFKITVEVPQ